jgi:hypothetical protein
VAVNDYRDTLHRHCCNHCYYGDRIFFQVSFQEEPENNAINQGENANKVEVAKLDAKRAEVEQWTGVYTTKPIRGDASELEEY